LHFKLETAQLKNMTEQDQKQLGNTLWGIADQLRGAIYANNLGQK